MQKHEQVLFLSDILGAGGGSVDTRYLHKRWSGERWSSMKFLREEVTVPEIWSSGVALLRRLCHMVLRRLIWVYLESMDTNSGSGY